VLRLGTRGSALALAQARLVAAELSSVTEVELKVIESSGFPIDDKSRWTRSLETALLNGEIDLAIHSAKDVPGERPDGIITVAVPHREDPTDAIIGATSVEALAPGAKVGTASPRRAALLAALREDLEVIELRGNVDTRLRRLADGDFDAIILASAGLNRLGVSVEAVRLDPDSFTPAGGQGSLLIEARSGHTLPMEVGGSVNDRKAELELTAERALIIALNADCHTAVGALARVTDDHLTIAAICLMPDGSGWVRDRLQGPAQDAALIGGRLAHRMKTAGADKILAAGRGEA
jgi:hydroxymethylbilane synthase